MNLRQVFKEYKKYQVLKEDQDRGEKDNKESDHSARW